MPVVCRALVRLFYENYRKRLNDRTIPISEKPEKANPRKMDEARLQLAAPNPSRGDDWWYVRGALRVLVSEHLRLEREALQKRITEIDGSASL